MPDWIKDLAAAGPAAIFAVMWWLERSERKDMSDRLLEAIIETKAALRTLVELAKPSGGK